MKNFLLVAFTTLYVLPLSAQKTSHPKTREDQLNEDYCTGFFKTSDGIFFDLATDNKSAISYLNILDWLQSRVAGLQVYLAKNGSRIAFIREQQATIYVDEIPVSPGYLNMLNVNDIALIKIIKPPFMGAFEGSGGAIAIYTKEGDE